MIRLGYRDEQMTPEELSLKNILHENMNTSSLDDAWSEFAKITWSDIDGAVEDYIDSEFNKTDLSKQLKFVNDTWEHLEKSKALSPEREQQLSNRGADLDDQADNFKRDLRKKLEEIKYELFRDIIKSKVD